MSLVWWDRTGVPSIQANLPIATNLREIEKSVILQMSLIWWDLTIHSIPIPLERIQLPQNREETTLLMITICISRTVPEVKAFLWTKESQCDHRTSPRSWSTSATWETCPSGPGHLRRRVQALLVIWHPITKPPFAFKKLILTITFNLDSTKH